MSIITLSLQVYIEGSNIKLKENLGTKLTQCNGLVKYNNKECTIFQIVW